MDADVMLGRIRDGLKNLLRTQVAVDVALHKGADVCSTAISTAEAACRIAGLSEEEILKVVTDTRRTLGVPKS